MFNQNFTSINLPTGRQMELVEQNGEHDGILTNESLGKTGSNYDYFVLSICRKPSWLDRNMTIEDVLDLPSNDFASILIQSRIFSIGSELRFKYYWPDAKIPVAYVEELNSYILDYVNTDRNPKPGDDNYNPLACMPYIKRDQITDHTFTTSSGNTFQFDLLTRRAEKKLLELEAKDRTINIKFTLRNLRWLDPATSKYIKVTNFSTFNKKEMSELHKAINSVDPDFQFLSILENPDNKVKTYINLIEQPDFFFPGEI